MKVPSSTRSTTYSILLLIMPHVRLASVSVAHHRVTADDKVTKRIGDIYSSPVLHVYCFDPKQILYPTINALDGRRGIFYETSKQFL